MQKMKAGIRFLKNESIDRRKWDLCIADGKPVLAYGFSTYLDGVCNGQWHGLVYNDYEAVFPLPYKKRFGLSYLCQPVFCQQLGAFGCDEVVDTVAFIKAIPWYYPRVKIQINRHFTWQHPPRQGHISPKLNLEIREKPNLTIQLDQPIRYKKDARRNLKRIAEYGIEVKEDAVKVELVIDLFRQAWGGFHPHLRTGEYERFRQAIDSESMQAASFETLVYSAHETGTNELLGAAIFLKTNGNSNSHGYLHYVCAAPTPKGRNLSVMHALIHQAITNHTGQPFCFDFEGSSIPSVSSFYRKFGPTENSYLLYARGL